jgi:hypothetical protein
MDHAGAVLGPLLALAVLSLRPGDLRLVFALSAIPGLLVILVLVSSVREPEGIRTSAPPLLPLPRGLGRFLLPLSLFTLGKGSELYLLLAVGGQRHALKTLPLLWMALHVVKSASSLLGGRLADRSARGTVALGWGVHVLVFGAFALVSGPWAMAGLFVLYGISPGLSEAAEKTVIASLVPADRRGTAFGWYNLTVGILALPAGALFGTVWQAYGPEWALAGGAALGAVGLGALMRVPAASR